MIWEIANCDATEYIRNIASDSVDLVVLDPNYNDWTDILETDFLAECVRTLKESGNIIAFTKQPFDTALRNAVAPLFRREIIWSFDNGGAWVSKKMPLVSFQKIYWCVKSKNFYFNPRTGLPYAENTRDFKRATKVFGDWENEGKNFVKSEEGIWLRDHLHFNKPNCGAIPAKPKELAQILIKCFSPPSGTVYDPFAGSGVITKVADEMGRNVIANEIEESRCHAIIDLFTPQLNNSQVRWEI